jgi:hypothetical protein
MAINLRWFRFLEGWIAMAENPTAVIDGENVSSVAAFVFSSRRFVLCCIADILVPVVGRMMLFATLWTWKDGIAVSQLARRETTAIIPIGLTK